MSPDPALWQYVPSDASASNLPGEGGVFQPVNMSSYAYAHQNPLNMIDPTGEFASKWGFWVHQEIIQNTLGGRVGARALQLMKQAQVTIDDKQRNHDQHLHAMRGAGISKSKAIEQANTHVRDKITQAIDAYKSGDSNAAWTALGEAMHTVQDAASPEHNGFQEFDADSSLLEQLSHALGELQYPGESFDVLRSPNAPRRTHSRQARAAEAGTVYVYDIFLQGVSGGKRRIGGRIDGVPDTFFGSDGQAIIPSQYYSSEARRGTRGRVE